MNSKKTVAKIAKEGAEKMAQVSTNFSALWFFYQPKCPSQLVKKD